MLEYAVREGECRLGGLAPTNWIGNLEFFTP